MDRPFRGAGAMDQLCREIAEHGRKIALLVASQKRLEALVSSATGDERSPMDQWLRSRLQPENGAITCSDCLTRLFTGTPIVPFVAGMLPRKKLVIAREAAAFRDATTTTTEQLRQCLLEHGMTVAFSIEPQDTCDHCHKTGATFSHAIGIYFLCDARIHTKRKADEPLPGPPPAKKVKFQVPK